MQIEQAQVWSFRM